MARKSKQISTKYRVAIVGEGETEWYYFTGMRQVERFGFKVEPDLPKHSDYKTLIKTARRKRDEGYDLVYCVLDLDRILTNQTEKQGYLREKSKIRANKGIEFIESMPCIELWFLLHFLNNYSTRVYLNYDQIKNPLKKFIRDYDKTEQFLKNSNIYKLLLENGDRNKAIEFADRLYVDKDSSGNSLFNFTTISNIFKKLNLT